MTSAIDIENVDSERSTRVKFGNRKSNILVPRTGSHGGIVTNGGNLLLFHFGNESSGKTLFNDQFF